MAATVERIVCVKCGTELARGPLEPGNRGLQMPSVGPSQSEVLNAMRLHRGLTGHTLAVKEHCITLEDESMPVPGQP